MLALGFAPQQKAPHKAAAAAAQVVATVPTAFSGTVAAQVVGTGSSPVLSVVGHAGGAGLRVDLLVDQGQVEQTALALNFPTGASCHGTVTSLGSDGLRGSCGSRTVRIDWAIASDHSVTGRLALGAGGA